MSVISKVLTAALYRIGATDLAVKMQVKIHEAVLQATSVANQTIAQATSLADQTVQEAQGIADTFTIRNVGTQDNVEGIVNAFARDPETGETEHMRIVEQQWPGDSAAAQHTVYDSIMYIGGEEVTV